MAWTTPRTWAANENVTAAVMNTHVRDNLNALSTHEHTGGAGDGAAILMPPLTNDKCITWLIPIPPTSTSAYSGDLVSNSVANGSVGTAPTWDATNKWMYANFSTTASASARVTAEGRVSAPVDLLPRMRWGVQHGGTTNNTIRCGMAGATVTTADPADGLFFRSATGGNWYAVARAGGVETATDTGVAASTTAPKSMEIKVVSAASVEFYIDDVLKATLTTNIPASGTPLFPFMNIANAASAAISCRYTNWMGFSYEVKSS